MLRLLASSFLFSLLPLQAAENQKPNIIWIIGDDLGCELGCYGDELANTPNIDRLAAEGARFTRAFSTNPTCSSSRSAFITGVYQTTIGAHHHRTMDKKPLPAPIVPVTHLLRDAGYVTVSVRDKALGANGKTDFNFTAEKIFVSESTDALKAARDAGRPFFAQFNYHEPHRTFKYTEGEPRTDPDKVKLPPIYPDHPIARKDWAEYLDAVHTLDLHVGKLLAWLKKEKLDQNTAIFFFGDHGRPHVWDKQWLTEGGLHVPLIVHWPEKIIPGSVRTDLVSLIDVPASALDIAARNSPVAEVAKTSDLSVPTWYHGQTIGRLNAHPRQYVFAARDRCGDATDRIRSVRGDRFKYIRNFIPELPYWQTSRYKSVGYPVLALLKNLHTQGKLTPAQSKFFKDQKPAEELYDLENDPDELINLAANPEHADKLKQFQTRLDVWIKETGDKGQFPEPVSLRKAAEAASERAFRKKWTEDTYDKRATEIESRVLPQE